MDRRGFLIGAGALCATGCRLFTGRRTDFDDSLAVLLADAHMCADNSDATARWHYTRDEFDSRIAEILAMDPLPRHVIFLGDLAFNAGDVNDYRLAHAKFRPLVDAGIDLTLGVGNHDRRQPFWDVFPETKASPVEGKVVSIVKMRDCDFILLDSLVGAAGAEPGGSKGGLDEAQQEWLSDFLPRCARPTFVAAHHETRELQVKGRSIVSCLKEAPAVVGWINGHVHRWFKYPLVGWGASNQDTIRGLSLPSSGLWGDIGFATLRTRPDGARVTLHQKGYWFNDRLHADEREPDVWKAIVAENRGQYCEFPFSRMMRKS